jgi:exopolysaccharide biosynthesis protein
LPKTEEKKKEMVTLERERLWKIFADGYEVIGNQIEEYFGGKEEIKKEGVKKEFYTFKELMVSGVDQIHKNILLEDAEIKAIEKKKKDQETTQDKVKEKVEKVKKSDFWD